MEGNWVRRLSIPCFLIYFLTYLHIQLPYLAWPEWPQDIRHSYARPKSDQSDHHAMGRCCVVCQTIVWPQPMVRSCDGNCLLDGGKGWSRYTPKLLDYLLISDRLIPLSYEIRAFVLVLDQSGLPLCIFRARDFRDFIPGPSPRILRSEEDLDARGSRQISAPV